MTRVLLFFLSILTLPICSAQHKELDSLLNLLQDHPKEDARRAGLLAEIARQYQTINPQKGLETAEEAITLARNAGGKEELAGAYASKGVNLIARGEDSLALDQFILSLKLYEESGNKKGLARVHHNAGIAYFNLSEYSKALEYQEKAKAIAGEIDDRQIHAAALNSIGVVYLYLSNYPRALDHFLQSLGAFEQQGNRLRTAFALTNIGIVHRRSLNLDKALEYSSRALLLFEELGQKQRMADVLGNMGNMHDDLGNTTKALELYQKQLAINEELGNKRGIASSLINTGIMYSGVSDYSRAIDYLERSRLLYEELGDKNSLAVALVETGRVLRSAPDGFFRQKGISTSRQHSLALEYLTRGLRLAEEIGAIDRQVFAWRELSEIYKRRKNFSRALEAYRQYNVLHDSILNDEKKNELTRKEMQFDFEKKEALLKAEHEKKEALAAAEKNAVMGGSLILLLGLVSSFAFYKKRRDAEEERKEAVFLAQVAETEMRALRSQMNPHFIFNSLNSISDYISKHDTGSADYYLTRFAKLMRLILTNSEQKEVPLADDLQALDLYLELESLRSSNKFSYEIQVDEGIDRESTLVPPLLLQPFVENSIWHGIARKKGEGRILVRITRESGMIACIVEDNGIGRKGAGAAPSEHKKQSLGLKVTKARIDILNRIRQSKATMELSDLAEGTRVEVKLPMVANY